MPNREGDGMMTDAEALDAAFQECKRTHRGSGPCYLPEYLAARRAYQGLMVKRGFLTITEAAEDAAIDCWRAMFDAAGTR